MEGYDFYEAPHANLFEGIDRQSESEVKGIERDYFNPHT